MSVFKKGKKFFKPLSLICAECGEELGDCIVSYDFNHLLDKTYSISLHPACAVTVGSRLISDGYPNRRKC